MNQLTPIKPIVWTIAGSDSGGGAGIQADLHTFQCLGVYGCSVITAITAQNSVAVRAMVDVEARYVIAQIQALQEDLPATAIKLGMLGNAQTSLLLRDFLRDNANTVSAKIILDPVMVAGCGDTLCFDDQGNYIKILQTFFPMIDLITPNIPEAEALTGRVIDDYAAMEKAAEIFLAQGIKNVLIKGGHFEQDDWSQDYWSNGEQAFWLATKRYGLKGCHGTGCTLSAAVTALLALGYELKQALVVAKMYISQGIRHAPTYGKGLPPVQHLGFPQHQIDLPYLSLTPMQKLPLAFPECADDLGIYPIVDSAKWLEILLPLGINTIQLRIKNKTGEALEQEIQAAVALSQQYGARLFINDYWQLAIKYQAYGVHLGQEDIATADIATIKLAGLRLGLSTHSYVELVTAHRLRPSYLAFGPVFATASKPMCFDPQGLVELKKIRRWVDYPLVAIGGINQQNIAEVVATGVDGIAMIAAITQAADPVARVRELMAVYDSRT